MVSRHWTGLARSDEAENYLYHLERETFPGLSAIPGFLRASVHTRAAGGGTEFLVITEWESLDSIRSFAGERPEAAVVPPAVQRMMIDYDREARHFEVAATYDPAR